MEYSTESDILPRSKKGERNPENWKRNVAKKERYSPKGLPDLPLCGHNVEHLKCTQLQMYDLLKFHEDFYNNAKKSDQDAFILKYCSPKDTKRRRPINNTRRKKNYHTNFTIKQGKDIVPVCQQTFLKTLGVTKHRVGFLMRNFFESGEIPTERRGGDRTSTKYFNKIESILNFLKKLESNDGKEILADLNINKLSRMYNNENPNVFVTTDYFRKIFNKFCNLSFATTEKSDPYSDYGE